MSAERRQIGGYTLGRKIGEGGMGEVYLAEHRYIRRRAAIKLLKPELSRDPRSVERFFNEARATSSICHPGLVEVLDCGVVGEQAFLVMEYLEGETLADRWARSPAPERALRELLGIGRQIAAAIAAAHASLVVHRDLKPANVFLLARARDEVPAVKVLDFGVAKLTSQPSLHLTGTGAVLGTPTYMAPEQCRGAGEVDYRADIYALGCILYEGLTGRPPFVGAGVGEVISAHMGQAPAPIARLAPHARADLAAYVHEMLAKEPRERPASMHDVAAALEGFGAGAPAPSPRPPVRPSVEATGAVLDGPTIAPSSGGVAALRTTIDAAPTPVVASGAPPARRKPGRGYAAAALALVGVAALAFSLRPEERAQPPRPAQEAPREAPSGVGLQAPPTVRVDIDGAPPGLTVTVDGSPQPLPIVLPRGGARRTLVLSAPGRVPRVHEVASTKDVRLDGTLAEAPVPAPPPRPSAGAARTPTRRRPAAPRPFDDL